MEHRQIYLIASEIRKDWKKVSARTAPHLDAMDYLVTMKDMYGVDNAKSIVLYFLCNASTWRGETAKRIKAELKAMCAGK
jgi:hypothetical protein